MGCCEAVEAVCGVGSTSVCAIGWLLLGEWGGSLWCWGVVVGPEGDWVLG